MGKRKENAFALDCEKACNNALNKSASDIYGCGSDSSHFLLTSQFNSDTGLFFPLFHRKLLKDSQLKRALLVSNMLSQHPL